MKQFMLFTLVIALLSSMALCAEVPPLSPAPAPEASPGTGLAQAVAVVDGYLAAVRKEAWKQAYGFLSAASKKTLSLEQWRASFRAKTASGALLFPGAEITNLTFSGNDAVGLLQATYQLPAEIYLTKEEGAWKIDLPATDREMVTSLAKAFSADAAKPGPASLPLTRGQLSPFITSQRIEQVELQVDKAKVKVVETAVVSGEMRFQRRGAFWEITSGSWLAGPSLAPVPAKSEPESPGMPGPRHWRP